MTVGYSTRKVKEIAKRRAVDPKKGKRGADSPANEEVRTTPPTGGQFVRKGRYAKDGIPRLSPQERYSRDGRSSASTPESGRRGTPTPYSSEADTALMYNRVRALVSANPPTRENIQNPIPKDSYPSMQFMSLTPDVNLRGSPSTAVPAGKTDGRRPVFSTADASANTEPQPPPMAANTGVERQVAGSIFKPSDHQDANKTEPEVASQRQHQRGSQTQSLNFGVPAQDDQSKPSLLPHATGLAANEAAVNSWAEAHQMINGCKGCHAMPPKGKRGAKKSSSDASSSREVPSRLMSEIALRKKIETALAKHMGHNHMEDNKTSTSNSSGNGDGNKSSSAGSDGVPDSKVQLKKMVDSVMSEISSSSGGNQRHEALHTPRGMRTYPAAPMHGGWPCPPHPHPMFYHGSHSDINSWLSTPQSTSSRHSRSGILKASIPSPSSAFSSKTSVVSSSSCDSGSSPGCFLPYAQWYPPPWASSPTYWYYPPPIPSEVASTPDDHVLSL